MISKYYIRHDIIKYLKRLIKKFIWFEKYKEMVYYRSIENATNEGKSFEFIEGRNVGIEKEKNIGENIVIKKVKWILLKDYYKKMHLLNSLQK